MTSLKGSKVAELEKEKARKENFIEALKKAQRNDAIAIKDGITKGLSQRDLCKKLEITIGTLSKYFRGLVDPLDVKSGIQKNLASSLSISLDSLIDFYSSGKMTSNLNADQVSSWIKENSKKDPKKIFNLITQIGNDLYHEQTKRDAYEELNKVKEIDSDKINNELRESWNKIIKSNNISIKQAWKALIKFEDLERILSESDVKKESLQDVLAGYDDLDCKDLKKYELTKKINQIISNIEFENE